jgi:hypothetical protein
MVGAKLIVTRPRNKRARSGIMPAPIVRCPTAVRPAPPPTVKDRIAAFLDGATHGEELLHALYDHVLDEPIPESMRRLIGARSE